MSTKTDEKPKGRRSSLKTHDANQLESAALKVKNKRNSVSWGQSNTFQFKAMKAMFQESNDINKPSKENEAKHKQFLESRKKSIKNEFSIVKEMMKNNKNMMDEEDDEDEEVKENTDKNVKIGKEALQEESSESSSSSHNDSEEEDNASGNEEEKNNEKDNEKDNEDNNEKEKEKEGEKGNEIKN